MTYKQGKLEKDSRHFHFEESILVNKSHPSQKTQNMRVQNLEMEKELNQEKQLLKGWLAKVESQK